MEMARRTMAMGKGELLMWTYNKTFLTNSDAHSLPKIAREYNKIQVEDISFKEIVKALKNEDGRKIIAG